MDSNQLHYILSCMALRGRERDERIRYLVDQGIKAEIQERRCDAFLIVDCSDADDEQPLFEIYHNRELLDELTPANQQHLAAEAAELIAEWGEYKGWYFFLRQRAETVAIAYATNDGKNAISPDVYWAEQFPWQQGSGFRTTMMVHKGTPDHKSEFVLKYLNQEQFYQIHDRQNQKPDLQAEIGEALV
jgi:hypothetical protein